MYNTEMLLDHEKNHHQQIFLKRTRISSIKVMVYADLKECNLTTDSTNEVEQWYSI